MSLPATAWALLLAGETALAQEPASFTHANFVTGDRSMQSLVEFPDIDVDVQVDVTCSGIATAKGRLKEAFCSAPNDPDLEFTMAVSRRFNSSRMVPATVDGKPEEVDFQFIVSFRKVGDNETISVYPNNGKNVDRLGLDYYSAQRYSPHVWPNRCGTATREDLVLEMAIIDAAGRPREVNIMTAEARLAATCRARLITQLEDGRWIPASYNGEFVESVWVSPIVLSRIGYKRQQ
ncbi:MAG: hypothetical protein OEM63_11960 [Gammaproteobacteria bacterium]|nr:hypothetical protein [Gammaproteobacteria bacterium]